MRQNILDEVIDGEPRYNVINNSDGTKRIELANYIIEPGTPINRALFRNLQGDIYTQDRYNSLSYDGNGLILNMPLTSYEQGKIIKIVSPTNLTNTTININNLGAKTINGNLETSKKYELVYNGTSFDAYSLETVESAYYSAKYKLYTSSGTYHFAKGVYFIIMVGGGGGGGDERGYNCGDGGSGAIAYGIIAYDKDTDVALTVGAGGIMDDRGKSGGSTSIQGYSAIAGGGTGGWASSKYVEDGEPGTFTGDNYFWGKDGTMRIGYYFLGTTYGKGGQGSDEDKGGATDGTPGVIIAIMLSTKE